MKKFKLFGKSTQVAQVEQTASENPHELCKILKLGGYKQYPYEKRDLSEDISVINQVIGEYWKPRFLVDEKGKIAVEFMNSGTKLQTVCISNIDEDLLTGLPQYAIDRAKSLDEIFPAFVRGYKNGIQKYLGKSPLITNCRSS